MEWGVAVTEIVGVLAIFMGLPAIILGFILGLKFLKIKKVEVVNKLYKNKIKLLEEENKKYNGIINDSKSLEEKK
jgi:hypothetical protein